MRDLIQIVEGQFRSNDIEEFVPDNENLDNLKSQFLPDWEMLDHRTLEATYVAEDHRHAAEFVNYINQLSEKMDHFALVTQDVSEVTVRTTTTDVKGLTILDFELAMRIDNYAQTNNIEQRRGGGNFS
jgi:pterin-4a-carbinolamine dehydratase